MRRRKGQKTESDVEPEFHETRSRAGKGATARMSVGQLPTTLWTLAKPELKPAGNASRRRAHYFRGFTGRPFRQVDQIGGLGDYALSDAAVGGDRRSTGPIRASLASQ
jgi:hypothetical protein